MRRVSLTELPPPPAEKTGWPWTLESDEFPRTAPDNRQWPRISIITPSYNQGSYLEETIRSILLQGYPNLEYIIMDGGSTDQSHNIICKYEPWLAYWISERDKGQSDAINRGFERATGDIFAWLNSDDIYEPGALRKVAELFNSQPECALMYGNGWYIDADSHKTYPCRWIRPFNRKRLLTFNFILQPAAFWRASLWKSTGEIDINLHWTLDWEWFIRATRITQPCYISVDLACWRFRDDIKTAAGGQPRRAEIAEICRKYGGKWQPTYMDYQIDQFGQRMVNPFNNKTIKANLYRLLTAFRLLLQKTIWRGLYMP